MALVAVSMLACSAVFLANDVETDRITGHFIGCLHSDEGWWIYSLFSWWRFLSLFINERWRWIWYIRCSLHADRSKVNKSWQDFHTCCLITYVDDFCRMTLPLSSTGPKMARLSLTVVQFQRRPLNWCWHSWMPIFTPSATLGMIST